MRPFCLVSCARLSRPFCAGCRIARISDGLVTDGRQTRGKSDSEGTVMTPSRATVRVFVFIWAVDVSPGGNGCQLCEAL